MCVIGGGLAGLAAAQQLQREGMQVVVLEASDRIGGRVRQSHTKEGDSYEVGGEFFHGGDASAHALAREAQLPTVRVFTAAHGDGGPDEDAAPDGGVARYWLGADRGLLPYDAADEDFVHLNGLLGELSESKVPASDRRSLAQYLRDEGVMEPMLRLAEASYSNTLGFGAALDRMPLAAVAALERRWLSDGDGDYRMLGPLSALSNVLARGVDIRTNWPVARVEQSGGAQMKIAVWCEDGRRLEVEGAVVAVPLPLLLPPDGGLPTTDEAACVRFSPRLPAAKEAALRSIAMPAALKICLVFDGAKRPWREQAGSPLHSVLCGDRCPVPEVWMRPRHGGKPGTVVHGFATGSYAEALGKMPQAEVVETFVHQLARVLPGASLDKLRGSLRHASVTDWAKERYIRGGYSTVSADELPDARAIYRAPEWRGLLCFAGEATQDAMMTMNAAIDSGRRAASELLFAIRQHHSPTSPRARL